MRCLIRRITRKTAASGHSEQTVEADVLSIGRGTDRDIFLSDLHAALQHALIRPAGEDRFAVQARTPSGVQINGRTVQAGVVKAGDVLAIGHSRLRLVRPPRGYTLAIEVEEARSEPGRRPGVGPTTLREAGLGKRRWAWLLFLLIGGLGLAVPLAQIHRTPPPAIDMSDHLRDLAADAGTGMPWRIAGGDRLWDSGALSRPHRFFGRECRACHRRPFERVTNDACIDCHADQPHHSARPDLLRVTGLAEQRCASCHNEHNGTEGLVATQSKLCVDCHREPADIPGARIRPVSGFGAASHPEFRVRLVSPTPGGGFDWRRVRMDQPLREDNGLIFPHDVHLATEGVESPDGRRVLACADCHRPDGAGDTMQPVRFERDCQACHRLNFEPMEPARELPHGQPDAVLAALGDYYARVALAGGYRAPAVDAPAVVRQRRPADDELDREQRRAALAWADAKAVEVAEEVIEYRTCGTCHDIERSGSAGTPQWHVAPVALTAEWYPEARFSHAPHTGLTCTDCHAAEPSARSADVLMPGAETCQRCHGDARSTARVASRCIDCHGFHTGDDTMGATHATR